jgi:hypothetical protein
VAQNIRGDVGRQAGQQGGCHDAVDAVGLRAKTKTKTYYAEAQAWDDASSPRCPTIKFLPPELLFSLAIGAGILHMKCWTSNMGRSFTDCLFKKNHGSIQKVGRETS